MDDHADEMAAIRDAGLIERSVARPVARGVRDALARAVRAHEEGRLDDAIAAYNLVLDLIPHQPDALQLLGLIAKTRGAFDEAERLMRASLASNPRQPHVSDQLAAIHRLRSTRIRHGGVA